MESLCKTGMMVLLLTALAAVPACGRDASSIHLERVLHQSWQSYRRHFITNAGQVRIPEEKGGTISEAQAYALLRALWAKDAPTFSLVYRWTYEHLSRAASGGDHLLSWRWGRRPDGTFGVLDANTATDADLDYALALVLAHRRGWQPPPGCPPYLDEARRVQADILAREVVRLGNGQLLLTPGNWHSPRPPHLLNPSYFSPAAYHLFIRTGAGTGAGAWEQLARGTYPLLRQVSQRLGDLAGVGLFPDWCQVHADGRASSAPGRDTRFGWEAVRVPFRIALDKLWFSEGEAGRLLAGNFLTFFRHQYQARGRLVAVYHYDGTPAVDYESPVLYAGVLAAALAAGEVDFARQMAAKVLSFNQAKGDQAYFEAPENYYANNWAWLGLALYAGWVQP